MTEDDFIQETLKIKSLEERAERYCEHYGTPDYIVQGSHMIYRIPAYSYTDRLAGYPVTADVDLLTMTETRR